MAYLKNTLNENPHKIYESQSLRKLDNGLIILVI